MPIIKSAKKAARQANKRKAQNEAMKKQVRIALKEFRKNPTAANMSKVQSEYDKLAKKGLIKKNTASRRKAKLVKLAKELGAKTAKKATAEKKPAAKKATTTKKATAEKKTTAAKKPAAKKTTKKAEK